MSHEKVKNVSFGYIGLRDSRFIKPKKPKRPTSLNKWSLNHFNLDLTREREKQNRKEEEDVVGMVGSDATSRNHRRDALYNGQFSVLHPQSLSWPCMSLSPFSLSPRVC